ncbi:MAG: hypothetical protein ACLPQY_17630, partial [Streptosporangiaceae bacterium]
MLAELLRHPPGAAPAAELAHGRRGKLPDLPGAGSSDRCSDDTNKASVRAALMLRKLLTGRITGLLDG